MLTDFAELYARYRANGLAARIGRGERPAVVVVDFMRGFTDPDFPLGMDLSGPLEATRTLLRAARAAGVPVVLLRSAYSADGTEARLWLTKMPGGRKLVENSVWTEFDPALEAAPADIVLTKTFASGFFGVPLASILTTLGVDTVLLAGATTSGCVRATALDSHQHGFRTTVVQEAVGDRDAGQHWASLFDLDAKYADVEDLVTIVAYVEGLGRGRQEKQGTHGSRPGARTQERRSSR